MTATKKPAPKKATSKSDKFGGKQAPPFGSKDTKKKAK